MRSSRVALLVAVSALALALTLLPCEAKKGKIKRSKQNREKLTSREEEFRTAPPVEARKRAEEAISLATETEPVTAQTNHTHSDREINPDVDARENVKSQASSPHALLSNHGQNLDERLFHAAHDGNVKEVEALMAAGADPNGFLNDNKFSALMNAVIGNHSGVVEVLLDKTKHPRQVIANVDHHNQFKGTALWFASKYALSGITKILLAHGAHHDPLDELGSTPLMMACKRADHPESVEIAKALLAKGASTDIKNLDGHHALDVALHHAHVAGAYEVHGLLAEHAEKKRQDLEEHHAAQYEEWKKGTPDPNDKTDARAALHAKAAMSGHVNVAEELMGDSPMY